LIFIIVEWSEMATGRGNGRNGRKVAGGKGSSSSSRGYLKSSREILGAGSRCGRDNKNCEELKMRLCGPWLLEEFQELPNLKGQGSQTT
jgi:hypothetical protein